MPPTFHRLWFGGEEAVDTAIRSRFGPLVQQALDGGFEEWRETPQGALALILLLDQFTRNIHRGTAAAYAGDKRALHLCRQGRREGQDRALPSLHRAFFYLPLEHAEERRAQDESVAAFEHLLAEAPPPLRETFQGFLEYAVRHREIIERFGHFPHRNAPLGRPSTPEEIAFLQQPGSSF